MGIPVLLFSHFELWSRDTSAPVPKCLVRVQSVLVSKCLVAEVSGNPDGVTVFKHCCATLELVASTDKFSNDATPAQIIAQMHVSFKCQGRTV